MARILVFGTFDMLHAGHEDFFKQARALHPEPTLVVSVARDVNTARIKGEPPRTLETKRRDVVASHTLVDEAVLGAEDDHIQHIASLQPDIIALGYDQEGAYVDGLEELLQQKGISVPIVRLEPHRPDVYKTSLLRDTMPE